MAQNDDGSETSFMITPDGEASPSSLALRSLHPVQVPSAEPVKPK